MAKDQLLGTAAARFGQAVGREVRSRRQAFVDAGVEDLGFTAEDVADEVDRIADYLETSLEEDSRRWVAGRAPICRAGQSAAIMFPSNGVCYGAADIARVVAAGNRVHGRNTGRAASISRLMQEVFDAVVPGRVNMELERSGPEFLTHALESEDVPLLIAYGGEQLNDELLERLPQGPAMRVVFEGPGKDPMIVLEGIDVDAVAADVVAAKFSRSGQRCDVPETFVVHASIHDALVDRLVDACASAKVGDATHPDTVIAPISSAKVPAAVAHQLADAVDRGAVVACGGKVDGQLVHPTVVTGVTSEMAIFQDETFAPVFAVARFEEEDEAVELARATRYGLGCTVAGIRAEAVADRLRGADYAEPIDAPVFGRFGTVELNRPANTETEDLVAPFGGYGKSGFVWREGQLLQGPKSFPHEATRG
ncbi:MAG TPA: aldehyde dehydrogenase [Baekduia sp.]|nr:aldehyde dehydrogenase [Baekduia sp.]